MSSNSTFDPELCTLDTCSLNYANIDYVPNLAGNVLFAALFGLLAVIQLGFGIRYRTWGFMVGMFLGLAGEVIGYVARIQMHYNPFTDDPFLMSICALTIAPAFLSASIYLCLARLVVVFGEDLSRFKPRTYTYVFMTGDFVALLLQAIGGAIASSADDKKTSDTGVNIMVAGLAWQVFTLFAFMVMAIDFGLRGRKSGRTVVGVFAPVVNSWMFKAFLFALAVATITIFTRSVFRAAELSDGFSGPLANDEISFMVLEGAMISIATIALTAFHPGVALRGHWREAGWQFKTRKPDAKEASYEMAPAEDVQQEPNKVQV